MAASATRLLWVSLPIFSGIDARATCPYIHLTSCQEPKAKAFLVLWGRRLTKPSADLLDAAGDYLRDVQVRHPYDRTWPLDEVFINSCTTGILLSIFSIAWAADGLRSWMIYEFGLNIIATCQFDETLFFSIFRVTPSQVAYVLYLLSYSTSWAHHIGNTWNPPAAAALLEIQLPESGKKVHDAPKPLVIDVGMGLGADTRYYLSQGFRVVAIEASSTAISRATSDAWLKPFQASRQLVVLESVLIADGQENVYFTDYERLEQSRALESKSIQKEASPKTLLTCSDLILRFGNAVYIKVDVEEQTADCIRSIYNTWTRHKNSFEDLLPRFLSVEIEDTGVLPEYVDMFHAMGYSSYKLCRQAVYSPAACESPELTLGCGSGPFGDAAVDYQKGFAWTDLDELLNDTRWMVDWERSSDWFDIHFRKSRWLKP